MDVTSSRITPPRFASTTSYGEALSDIHVWRLHVRNLLACHKLHLKPNHRVMRMGTAGTFPTVLVDDAYVVKFFGPLFNGQESAAIERAMYRLLATDPTIPAPRLIASGALAPDDDWRWEYIVSTQLPGESYGTVRERLSAENQREVARFIADVTTRIHRLIPAPEPSEPLLLDWKRWDAFMTGQMRSCTERHRAWGTLPHRNHLIDQIAPYLARAADLLAHSDPPVLQHCDLTGDHILGEWRGKTWTPTGIIDFGDAKIGDRVYELVALHIECFGGDKDLLRVFLDRYGCDSMRQPDFARRAMSMTLLHEFNVLETVFSCMPEARDVTTLDQLATALWDVNG